MKLPLPLRLQALFPIPSWETLVPVSRTPCRKRQHQHHH